MPVTFSRLAACLVLILAFVTLGRSQDAKKDKDKEKPKDVATTDLVDGKGLEEWIKDLRNPDPFVRGQACLAVGKYGTAAKEAKPILIERLSDIDSDVFLNALSALQSVGFVEDDYPAMAKRLQVTLQKGAQPARIQATLTLAALGTKARGMTSVLCVGPNAPIKDRFSWQLRRTAAYTLGRIAYDEKAGADVTAIRALCGAVSGLSADPCSQVRLEAVLALGGLGKPKSMQELQTEVNALTFVIRNDKDVQCVIWARALLAVYDEKDLQKSHVEYIHSRLMKSKDTVERSNAANALAALGAEAKDRAPDLIQLLGDRDQVVATSVAAALGQMKNHLTDQHIGMLTKMSRIGDSQVRTLAINVVGKLGEKGKPFAEELISLLRDNDESVANSASTALGQMSADLEAIGNGNGLSDQQVGSVAALLRHDEPRVRCMAAQTLMLLGFKAKSYIPDLAKALSDRDPQVIECAMVALMSYGPESKEALPALEKLSNHKNVAVRRAAVGAIAVITGKAPIPEKKKEPEKKVEKDTK